ncbi:MAG TPA: hypothetical protein VLA19_17755 [Herpetosiphonaceae bacterium]|nr:hypothetical protein [Herpetosiphonaceae bacterium]
MINSNGQGKTDVQVHVKSLKTNDKTHFKVSRATTLRQVWDEAIKPSGCHLRRTGRLRHDRWH